MKALRFFGMVLITVLLSVGFAACSSDDDDDIGNVSTLYGTWETTHFEGWEKINGELDDEWNEDASESEDNMRLAFASDGEVTIYYKSGSSWSVDEVCDYTISGNKLYIKEYDGDEDWVCTIKTLNASTLVIESSSSETEDGDKYQSYEKVTFKKVN